MRRARVLQPIAAIPAGIKGSLNETRRASFILAPRHDRGLVAYNLRGGGALVVDLATGERRELDRKAARAQLDELGQLLDQAEQAPQVLRGRWAAQIGWTLKKEPQVKLSRRLGYVDLQIEYSGGGRWTVSPPKRRPAWFSEASDWSAEPRTVGSLREAFEVALELGQAGIKLACTRRDTQRREEPAAARTKRAKRSRKVGGVQAGLFAA